MKRFRKPRDFNSITGVTIHWKTYDTFFFLLEIMQCVEGRRGALPKTTHY